MAWNYKHFCLCLWAFKIALFHQKWGKFEVVTLVHDAHSLFKFHYLIEKQVLQFGNKCLFLQLYFCHFLSRQHLKNIERKMSDNFGECLVFKGFDIETKRPILSIEKFFLPSSSSELKVSLIFYLFSIFFRYKNDPTIKIAYFYNIWD